MNRRSVDRASRTLRVGGEGITRTMIDTLVKFPLFSAADRVPTERIPRKLTGMKTLVRLAAYVSLLPAGLGFAAAVPTFQTGEYLVTTSFGDSEALVKKVCLTNYTDWFDSLRDDFKERGCNLVAQGQEGAAYRYGMDCSNGTNGTLLVTKHSESHFESLAEVELPIAGFMQTITMRDVAKRIGECPPE
jgi:hypothetical protein